MFRKSLVLTLIFIFALSLVLILSALRLPASMLMAQMMGDPRMGYDMRLIHQLSANHDQIHRTVKQLPNGIQAITESNNPQVALLLKAHVSSMYQRLEEGRPFPMIQMFPTLPELFRSADRYQRHLTTIPHGVEVSETSHDSDLRAIIRDHAHEVDGFVKVGMHPGMNGIIR